MYLLTKICISALKDLIDKLGQLSAIIPSSLLLFLLPSYLFSDFLLWISRITAEGMKQSECPVQGGVHTAQLC